MNTNKNYIFIDNIGDFNLYKKHFNQSKTIWVSSSPAIINKLSQDGYKIENIEKSINKNQINVLMRLSYKLSHKILSENSIKINFINKYFYKTIFYRDLACMIGSYLYKYYLLSNFIKKKKYKCQICFYW